MATPGGQYITLAGLTAAADLSAAQYKAVKLNTTGQVALVAAATDAGIGVLLNDPAAAGDPALVAVLGEAKGLAGGNINEGASLGFNTTGQFVATTTDNARTCGYAIQAASAGQLFKILLTGPARY